MLRNPITAISTTNKSRLTNGRLPAGVDGRSPQARRFRDLMRGYEAEFEAVSEIDRSTIRTAATLALKIEDMEAAQLRGEPVDAGDLMRLAGQLRRLLADLKRKAEGNAPAPVSILDHLAASQDQEDGD
jgi:hypothetical protein